jgi:signal transduction histidine kinase
MSDLVSARELPSGGSVAARLAHDSRVRYVLLVGLLAGSYYGAAQIGYTLKFTGAVAAIVWLPVGVGIAFLYIGGMRLWPGVVAGDLLANQYETLPVGSAIGQTIGNTLEVVVAAYLLHKLVRSGRPLDSVPGVCGLIVAIFTGVAVSATVGPFSLRLGHVLATSDLPHVWHTWWLGDTAGALVVVPFALAWWQPIDPRSWTPARVIEGALMLAAVIGLSDVALRTDRPLVYIVFPSLIWAALRFGPRGGTLAVAVAVGFTLWRTAHHSGPFVVDSVPRSTLSTQLYVGVAAMSTMFLAAVVSEREEIAKGLLESRARLVGIADRERRRLEHNLHDGAQLTLTMLAGQLTTAREDSRRHPDQAPALFEDAERHLLVAIDQLRELAHGIHPTILTDLGLAEAIRSLTDVSPVPIRLLELPPGRLDPTAEATAYYVVAEALTNAQRHAHAETITIRVVETGRALRIEVADDGAGGANDRFGSGLLGLRDRVEAIGGDLRVASVTGRGTQVVADIPLVAPGGRASGRTTTASSD